MYKNLLLLGLLVIGVSTMADAAPRPELQKAKGGFKTSLAAGVKVSGSAEQITGVSVSCGGSACEVALYDSDEDGVTNSEGVFELGAAANTTRFIDLSDRPIRTKNGVMAQSDGNESALVVYTTQATP